MPDRRTQAELDERWDKHTERQIAVSKGGIAAVTILNSGSWLALLTQADKLASLKNASAIADVVLYWGLGAFFGTMTWLFVYLNTLALAAHDYDRDSRLHEVSLSATRYAGMAAVLLSLALFVAGVWSLSSAIGS